MSLTGKIALFVGGALFGSYGIELLKTKEVRKACVSVTAVALRCREIVMKDVTTLQENCQDIYADALDLNEARAAQTEAVPADVPLQ